MGTPLFEIGEVRPRVGGGDVEVFFICFCLAHHPLVLSPVLAELAVLLTFKNGSFSKVFKPTKGGDTCGGALGEWGEVEMYFF